jgi:hypothetical protein
MAVRAVATAFIMMLTVVTSMAAVFTLTVATSALAQSDVPGPGMQDGIVAEVDTAAGVVKLDDGRMYRLKPGAELVYRGSPTPLGALRPGNYITISGAEPVVYRDGQYVQSSGS